MATVKVGKSAPKSVSSPAPFKFLHGTYPPAPAIDQVDIKPAKAPRRDYGKARPLAMDPGSEGLM